MPKMRCPLRDALCLFTSANIHINGKVTAGDFDKLSLILQVYDLRCNLTK